jgi:hypothetical protein
MPVCTSAFGVEHSSYVVVSPLWNRVSHHCVTAVWRMNLSKCGLYVCSRAGSHVAKHAVTSCNRP